MSDPDQSGGTWTLLTGHGHVLVEIARNPKARIRDISPVVGLTERTVQAIVADLEAAGYLTRTRTGRRVVYTVNRDSLFRHSAQEGHRVGPFLDLLAADRDRDHTRTGRRLRPGWGLRAQGMARSAYVPAPPASSMTATAAQRAPPRQIRRVVPAACPMKRTAEGYYGHLGHSLCRAACREARGTDGRGDLIRKGSPVRAAGRRGGEGVPHTCHTRR